MPTHVILGATGGFGSAALHELLELKIPDLAINILVRSKDKLLKYFPDLETPSNGIRINIFTGSFTDHDTLVQCLKDASVIYQGIAATGPSRKTEVSVKAANAVVKALEELRQQDRSKYERPTVLINRSTALNPDIIVPVSRPFFRFLKWAIRDVYEDVAESARIFEASPDLINVILLDAPNLFHPYATTKTGYELFIKGPTTLGVNYADFGAAAVEVASRREEFNGKAVGIRATGEVVPAWGPNLNELAEGVGCRLKEMFVDPLWYRV